MSNKRFNYAKQYDQKEKTTEQPAEVVEEAVEETVEEAVEKPAPKATKETDPVCGVVTNCSKLNIRKKPDIASEALCQINVGSEVMIDEKKSTKEWYRVCTTDGVVGFCMKKYVLVK